MKKIILVLITGFTLATITMMFFVQKDSVFCLSALEQYCQESVILEEDCDLEQYYYDNICNEEPRESIFLDDGYGYDQEYSPFNNSHIGEYPVYYENYDLALCSYLQPMDIVIDLYYTEQLRVGYTGIPSGSCIVGLYIYTNNILYSLSEAFIEGFITIDEINNANLDVTLREQILYNNETFEQFGPFGSIVKEYTNHTTSLDLYYLDYSGFTCTFDVPYLSFIYGDRNSQILHESIRSGENCGSDIYYYGTFYEYTHLSSISHSQFSNIITSEEYNLIIEEFNFVTLQSDVPYISMSNLQVYPYVNGSYDFDNPYTLSNEFLSDFQTEWFNLFKVYDLDETDRIDLLNLYDIFHQESEVAYLIRITLHDDSYIDFEFKNNVFYNMDENSYMAYGDTTYFSSYLYFEIDDDNSMNNFNLYDNE